MINALSDSLAQFMPSAELRLRNLIADVLLSEAERNGMLPPEVETKHWNRQDNCYYTVNEWEPEHLGPNKIIPAEDFDRIVAELEEPEE